MTRVPTLNSPFLLGFDDIERALDRVTRTASDGYPPYNIERIARSETHLKFCVLRWLSPASRRISSRSRWKNAS